VAEVAGALSGGDVPLVILPAGTGNAAAQELGIPLQLGDAARLVLDDDARIGSVDLLHVGERVSLLRVGVGFDARTVTGASRELKDQLGWFAYPLTALRELGDAQPARIALEVDGARREIDAYAVVVANVGRIGRAGARFPGDVDPFDGLADVFLLRSMDLGALVKVGARLLRLSDGDAEEGDAWSGNDPLLHVQARAVRIESPDGPLPVHADGDPHGETPVEVEVRAGALRLVLPPAPLEDAEEQGA
jgi:diacylglycerol kinase family enzyme